VDLPVCSDSCEDCGRKWGPRNVPNHTVEVKGEHWIPEEGIMEEDKDLIHVGKGRRRGQEEREEEG